MKIIDNRKDFYDFSAGIYDTDERVVYVRKTVDYQKNDINDDVLIENVKSHLKNRIPEYMYKQGTIYANDQIYIEHLILGIYPNVYIVPFIVITEYDKTNYRRYRNTHTIPMPFDIYEDDNAIVSYVKNKYPELEKKTFKLNTASALRKSIFKDNFVTNKEFIFEDIELFVDIINAPTFIYMTDFNTTKGESSAVRDLIIYKRNNTHTNHYYYTNLIINPVFTDYDSKILKHIRTILDNRPVYNDIENFLWMTKQEPISEPDNKTKIINHGFDLKTSFRKM